MFRFYTAFILCLVTGMSQSKGATETIAPVLTEAGNICRMAIAEAEIRNNIPDELMQAVALNESGKWNEKDKSLIAWPWTLTVEGEGHYYESFDETRDALKKYQSKGITNIDVGCMQINLGYHGKNFQNVEEVLDPINNVAYSAAFLTHLRVREHSWTRAVKFYHSANRVHHTPYSKKVIKTWQSLRKAKMTEKNKTRPISKPAVSTPVKSKVSTQVSTLSHWPPKNYKAQKNIESLARSKSGTAASYKIQ